ncbi:MAG TPA: xanthine dehydrogenase family protein subunit M [Candidatus Limnocylindria bacterium]|nr:xanthine dehydrogenase family protein subunit M [Candidatus Limnocylindria bacterium]
MTYDYHEPESVAEALDLLARHGGDAHLVAGATAFTLLWRQGLLRPGHVIGLRRIASLGGITSAGDGLVVGATVTHRAIERSADVARYCPALTRTFASVATVRVRNQATLGGNLAHADPAQDPPPMLMALGAGVVATSATGERTIPVDELFVDVFTTSLRADEILTSVRFPALAPGTRATYLKFLPRTADDYATVSVAAALRLAEDGTVADARIALGACGPTPVRARSVETALNGARPDARRIADAAARVDADIEPFDDVRGSAAYKRDMARVWTERAITSLVERPS